MKITIISVGKIKEKFYKEALDEYAKRLKSYCKFEIIEVPDEKTKEDASETEMNLIKLKEGQRILSKIDERAFVICLAIEGKKMDSIQLSSFINKQMVAGRDHFVFIIGGSLGLHETVLNYADFKLSFSDFTFPHQLMRVILIEQIYRTFRIMNHEPYHK